MDKKSPIDLHKDTLIDRLRQCVREIHGYPDCQNTCKKMYDDLARRVKLLRPLFEELMDGNGVLRDEDFQALELLCLSLNSAKELLASVNGDSKIYQALQIDFIEREFCKVTAQIDKALDKIAYDKLNISEEVEERIELVHHQIKRAIAKFEYTDTKLDEDLAMVQKENEPDPAVLRRLSEKDIQAPNDVRASEIPSVETSESATIFIKYGFPMIPDDFRCPISCELMRDPVIVSTGQSYERANIQKWLDLGHKTCPKTQQTLSNSTLTPNYALKSLISVWCESNGLKLREKQDDKGTSDFLSCDPHTISSLMHKLGSKNIQEQRAASAELRLLTKRNADYRICFAEAGVVPLLVKLLSSSDDRVQEHAVTTLLNLSINDTNKVFIANAKAIPEIVNILKTGNMEARENAAATLFSLSAVDIYKTKIGSSGAIPALIDLLYWGTPRGKTDAATAIFNVCLVYENRGRAIGAGILGPLLKCLEGDGGGMLDEALALLAILASHHDGRVAIGEAEVVPVLVDIIRTGSPCKRENAISVLWSLCVYNSQHLRNAKCLGTAAVLMDRMESMSDRGKNKAKYLLDLIQSCI